jgi:hypothetical protein
MNELHKKTELVADLHVLIRDKICDEFCPGGRHCKNMTCLHGFFEIAGEIENELFKGNENENK